MKQREGCCCCAWTRERQQTVVVWQYLSSVLFYSIQFCSVQFSSVLLRSIEVDTSKPVLLAWQKHAKQASLLRLFCKYNWKDRDSMPPPLSNVSMYNTWAGSLPYSTYNNNRRQSELYCCAEADRWHWLNGSDCSKQCAVYSCYSGGQLLKESNWKRAKVPGLAIA